MAPTKSSNFEERLNSISKVERYGWVPSDSFQFTQEQKHQLVKSLRKAHYTKTTIFELIEDLEDCALFYVAAAKNQTAILTREQVKTIEVCLNSLKHFEHDFAQLRNTCAAPLQHCAQLGGVDVPEVDRHLQEAMGQIEGFLEATLSLRPRQGAPIKWRESRLAIGVVRALLKQANFSEYKASQVFTAMIDLLSSNEGHTSDSEQARDPKHLIKFAKTYLDRHQSVFSQRTSSAGVTSATEADTSIFM